jgi:serine/threonine protein kinase
METQVLRLRESHRYIGSLTLGEHVGCREVVSNAPYGFSTDLWSVGCLVLACLTGKPPFEVCKLPTAYPLLIVFPMQTQKPFTRLKNASYDVPEAVSFEFKDLISGFLQIVSFFVWCM